MCVITWPFTLQCGGVRTMDFSNGLTVHLPGRIKDELSAPIIRANYVPGQLRYVPGVNLPVPCSRAHRDRDKF
jgi:hypothetical protein